MPRFPFLLSRISAAQCDGRPIPLPSLQGIAVLNIPSYAGGTNFWGGTKEDDVRMGVPGGLGPSWLWVIPPRGTHHFRPRWSLLGGAAVWGDTPLVSAVRGQRRTRQMGSPAREERLRGEDVARGTGVMRKPGPIPIWGGLGRLLRGGDLYTET